MELVMTCCRWLPAQGAAIWSKTNLGLLATTTFEVVLFRAYVPFPVLLPFLMHPATDPEAWVRFPVLPEKKVVGLERSPLSLVSTTEKLLHRKVTAPDYKTENTAVGIRPVARH
jgi:hypothetical protein